MSFCITNLLKTCSLHRSHIHRTISKHFISRWNAPVMFAGHYGRNDLYSCELHNRSFSTTNRLSRLNRDIKDVNINPAVIITNPITALKRFLKNKFMTFLIQFHYDDTFSADSFLKASRQAIIHVSRLMSAGQFQALHGLLDPALIADKQKRYEEMTREQKELISIPDEYVKKQYIHEIGMIVKNENNSENEKVFIEVTVMLHAFRMDEKNLEGLTIICRFIREFTKDVESDWIINSLEWSKIFTITKK